MYHDKFLGLDVKSFMVEIRYIYGKISREMTDFIKKNTFCVRGSP